MYRSFQHVFIVIDEFLYDPQMHDKKCEVKNQFTNHITMAKII